MKFRYFGFNVSLVSSVLNEIPSVAPCNKASFAILMVRTVDRDLLQIQDKFVAEAVSMSIQSDVLEQASVSLAVVVSRKKPSSPSS